MRKTTRLIAGLAVMLMTATGQAQLEEIVVTAQRREQTLQDTPLAVSAFTTVDLDRFGYNDIRDLRNQLPSVHFTEGFTGAITTTLRGIETTNTQALGDQVVAYHVDGIYTPRPTSFRAIQYDIERIEVLRGPQGTLYGRNATAGSINVLTQRPTDVLEGRADVAFGDFDQTQIRAMLNVPVSDSFALRGMVLHDEHEGYQRTENSMTPDGRPLSFDRSDDPWNADGTTYRVGALFEPSDDFSWYITYEDFDSDHATQHAARILPQLDPDPFTVEVFGPSLTQQETKTVRTRIDWGINANIEFSYLGAWGDEEILQGRGPAAGPALILISSTPFDNEYTTHELQLKSREGSGPLTWIAGAFYFDEESDNTLCADFYIPLPGPPFLVSQGFCDDRPNTTATSEAVYGQGTYAFNDQLRFTLGVRYTDDEKSSVHTRVSYPPPFGKMAPDPSVNPGLLPGGFVGPTTTFSDTWDDTSFKIGVDWNVSDTRLLYGNITTGYKAGGFAHPPGRPYDPETILSYEFGTKNTLMDGRLNLNGTLYYYDYEDLQVSTVVPDPNDPNALVGITANAATADLWGIELEWSWAVSENGRFFGHATYMDSEYASFPAAPADPALNPAPPGVALPPQDITGNRMPRTPDLEFTLNYQHAFDLSSGAEILPSISVHYSDDYFTRIYNTQFDGQDSYTTVDLNVRYTSSNDRFFVEAFGKNLTDETVLVSGQVGVGGALAVSLNPPRTYGIRLGASFGQ